MTDPGLFDRYAKNYCSTVDAAITVSGESAAFFSALKSRLTASIQNPRMVHEILDFGCGVGMTTRALLSDFAGANVTGYDQSTESIEIADRLTIANRKRARFVSGSDESLPFENESFDTVFASCVFHHIERDRQLHWASELCRVLRPGGSVMIFEHNPYNPLTRRVVRECPFDEGVVLLSAQYTAELLARAGLKPDQPKYYFFFPHILRALRPLETWLRRVPIGAQYFVVGRRLVGSAQSKGEP